MRRCETAKNRQVATEAARVVFAAWKAWDVAEPTETVVELDDGEGGADDELAGAAAHKSGRNISLMWAHMIRILSRCVALTACPRATADFSIVRSFADAEALALFQTFITQYPPTALVTQAEYAREAVKLLPTLPSPMRLASALYPETHAGAADRPPYLLFDQVRLLHMRLAEVDNARGVATVKGICKAYEGALAKAREIEEGVSKNQKKRDQRWMEEQERLG